MRNLIAAHIATTTAVARHTAGRDTLGHSGVQPWSAGDIFPCIIARIERYGDELAYHSAAPLAERLLCTSWELSLDGRAEEYASYDDADSVARALLADPAMRAQWRAGAVRPVGAYTPEEERDYGAMVERRARAQLRAAGDAVRLHDDAGVT